MNITIPEKDWKYLKSIQPSLLSCLCERINRKSLKILHSKQLSEHEKYLSLYQHLHDSNKLVGDCFDDWRRSTLFFKIAALLHHKLLSEDQLAHLTAETQNQMEFILRK
jgi:hypothetical protein